LVERERPERALARLYPPAMGAKAWPPRAMLEAPLLASWCDSSGMRLAGRAQTGRALARSFRIARLWPRGRKARVRGLCALAGEFVACGLANEPVCCD
jgi:hypothetical protein